MSAATAESSPSETVVDMNTANAQGRLDTYTSLDPRLHHQQSLALRQTALPKVSRDESPVSGTGGNLLSTGPPTMSHGWAILKWSLR